MGEIRCKYCGALLISLDGDRATFHDIVVAEEYIFCANCRNIIKSDIVKSFFGLEETSIEGRRVNLDNLYNMIEEEDQLKIYEGLPKIKNKVIVRPVFSDNNKVYENCVLAIGQIRNSTNVLIKDSTIIAPASALLKRYPFIEDCEHIALVNIEFLMLEQFIGVSKLLEHLLFDSELSKKLNELVRP